MKKFKSTILVILFAALSSTAWAQPKGWSAAFQLNEFQNDFGMGLQLCSPHFLNDKLSLRLKGHLQYLQYESGGISTWSPYGHLSLGMASTGYSISERIRIYGEGGVNLILPSSSFSARDMVWGGYGIFGFEFFLWENYSYFIELGAMGAGTTADLLPNQKIYSNGFMSSVGGRFYF